MRDLTKQEKAAIMYGYFNELKRWTDIYDIAFPDRQHGTEGARKKSISDWKRDPDVQEYYERVKAFDERRTQAKIDAAIEKYKLDPSGTLDSIDFTDFNQLVPFLSRQANAMTDEKDRRDYLKMLADLMRFKEGSQDKDQEIMQFYVPMKCDTCPLHLQAEKELEEEA